MKIINYIFFTVSILFSTSALAFDGNRGGFLLGFGGGLHNTSVGIYFQNNNIESYTRSGLATSVKIGGGITNNFALYFVRNAVSYSAPYYQGLKVKDATYVLGITGIGGAYYLSPSAPSVYFHGGIGVGDLSAPLESDTINDTGSAFMFGAGYEFKAHLMLEGTLLSTKIESSDNSAAEARTTSLLITVNYVFY